MVYSTPWSGSLESNEKTTFPFRINMYTRLLISRLFSNVHDLIRVYTFIRVWLLNLNSLYIFFVVYSIFHICLSKRIEINMSCQHFYSLTAYFGPLVCTLKIGVIPNFWLNKKIHSTCLFRPTCLLIFSKKSILHFYLGLHVY